MALLPNRGTKARWPVSKGRVCYMHELTKIAMALWPVANAQIETILGNVRLVDITFDNCASTLKGIGWTK